VDVVLLNLPTNHAVEDRGLRPDGLSRTLNEKQLLVDSPPSRSMRCRDHAARLAKQTGCRWVDAPSRAGRRRRPPARSHVMAGGTEEDLARLAPLMRDISGRCTRMGPVSAGLAAKMINQLIVGVGHAMLAEGVSLCEKAASTPRAIPECLPAAKPTAT